MAGSSRVSVRLEWCLRSIPPRSAEKRCHRQSLDCFSGFAINSGRYSAMNNPGLGTPDTRASGGRRDISALGDAGPPPHPPLPLARMTRGAAWTLLHSQI